MKLTDEQTTPVPERSDLPAVWDLVLQDVADCGPAPEDVEFNHYQMLGTVLALVQILGKHLGTDVRQDMRERDATGRARYGTPLQPWNGRRALVDAYQELLDAAVYLRQDLYETENPR